MSKVISTKSMAAVRGGKGHMVGKQRSGTSVPNKTTNQNNGGGGRGGKGHMAGFTGSKPSKAL